MNNRLYKVTTSPLQANLRGGIPDCVNGKIFFFPRCFGRLGLRLSWPARELTARNILIPILEYRGFNLEQRLFVYSRS